MHRGLEHGEKKAAWRSVLQCAGACTVLYCAVLCCTNSSNYESHISLIILTYTRITDTQPQPLQHCVVAERWQLITAPANWNFK